MEVYKNENPLALPYTTPIASTADGSFTDTLNASIDGLEQPMIDIDSLPDMYRDPVKMIHNDALINPHQLIEMHEMLEKAFMTFIENFESDSKLLEKESARLETVSMTFFHMAFSFGHKRSIDSLLKGWELTKQSPKLKKIAAKIEFALMMFFSCETCSFKGFKKSQTEYVSYHEQRSMTVSFQFMIWNYMKSNEHDDVVSKMADHMVIPNPLIEKEIVEDSPIQPLSPPLSINLS